MSQTERKKWLAERKQEFEELMKDIDKKAIIDTFVAGFDVGFFGNYKRHNTVNIQFEDKLYHYIITRQPKNLPPLQARPMSLNEMMDQLSRVKGGEPPRIS